MNLSSSLLRYDEKAVFALRRLYRLYGYAPYKMNKFEEYDLYVRNKDFLISDNVITFTDLNGKLMALKPDVTLSIIKNGRDLPGETQKVYYDENVYRVAKGANTFKEILQVGLECVGQIDDYQIAEVASLAAQSLRELSEGGVLAVSHLGIVGGLLDRAGVGDDTRAALLKAVGEKNAHDLAAVAAREEIEPALVDALCRVTALCGRPDEVLAALEKMGDVIDEAALSQLRRLTDGWDEALRDMLRIDFSIVGDTRYYNGIVFQGFLPGVPTAVLTGGQYDRLMRRMHRRSGAIGFAVYLDTLERLSDAAPSYDVDVLLLYDEGSHPAAVRRQTEALIDRGESVMAQRRIPAGLRYRRLIQMKEGEVILDEEHA
ncbi:MAG: ATP phosphoribosyltransferase regulatory subunit [Acutalibacteraceae bacterium]|jgi:ATP phosphoribosyltransferase regulatory subunit